MRAEQTLGMYSFENFVFHILHQRYEGLLGGSAVAINYSQSSKVYDRHSHKMVPYWYSKPIIPCNNLPC